jgi:hypothetical protein
MTLTEAFELVYLIIHSQIKKILSNRVASKMDKIGQKTQDLKL